MPAPALTPHAELAVAGETLQLLPQRAALWPARRMLLVADIHIGKAAAFRAGGVPVPAGTTLQNLEALDRLLRTHDIDEVMFLGDFLHARAGRAPATLAALQAWRERHARLALTLVRGNHDSHAGDPPASLDIEVVDEPHRVGPFLFCHHPEEREEAYVIAGHVHPVFRLAAGGDSLRLPCFLFGPKRGMLPSFGAFTGGHAVTPLPGERLFLAAEDRVFALPSPTPID
ncbi:putative phosphoesterase [Noviherbaspirillum humi]|uniref:Putative phosphoesterase n=1 Tax=Noviherbaspirillum humi TaxID=1688639 RepID=A0A239E1W6_9BURK|nr:ligase-associated DNA damage response endonuclease PdeM [Noviherbaspirillum humi]SNS37972.1 putative phosphoesterase [Noviherbaspirillum humi]